uniref:Uncharacterized protein n=1 Tax=Romanomermis culicivorax TaxID=13658 RepID=A0A915HHF3_ROMCU
MPVFNFGINQPSLERTYTYNICCSLGMHGGVETFSTTPSIFSEQIFCAQGTEQIFAGRAACPELCSPTISKHQISKKHKLVVWITRVVMFSKIDKHISTLYFAVDSTVLNIKKLQ